MSVSTKTHSYGAYLNSPQWQEKRAEALERANYRCQACGFDEQLEVHHRTYERLGHERPTDLEVLCNPCHSFEHGRAPKSGPVAGLTLEEMALANEDRQRDEYRNTKRAALQVMPEKLEAIKTIEMMVSELPYGSKRTRLKKFLRENARFIRAIKAMSKEREEVMRFYDRY